MAITPLFTTAQTIGEPSKILLTDTSTGTDTQSITKRRVYVTDKNGDYIVEEGTITDYENWDTYPSVTTITLDLFDSDTACDIQVDWLNAANVVQQTLTLRRDFTLYAVTYYIFLIKSLSNNEKLKNSANFSKRVNDLLNYIEMADDAITLLDDISSSQAALNRAKELINQPSNFF